MRNFDYLKKIPELASLYGYCNAAELMQQSAPDISALNARRALEWMVRAIYAMKEIEVGPRTSLFELIDGEPFRAFVGDDRLMMAVHYIRKVGNCAAHMGNVSGRESFFALLNLYNFVGAVLVKLQIIDELKPFDKTLLTQQASIHILPEEEPKPSTEFIEKVDVSKISEEPVKAYPTGISEAETRRLFIDMMLREAGWEVLSTQGAIAPLKACVEVEVHGMPTDKGIGYADYVLFGTNGKPLAVVEAKRTSLDLAKGRHQATLYADCLEAQYGVRPVVYCSNGYETEVVDGLGYPARKIYGFHTAADLELMVQRRGRQPIVDMRIDDNITNREYQKRAIRSICDRFNANHRSTLLVMATGTGKTRVAISLVDVLMRNNWVKNVLFLADRTALVKQAAKNFAKLLPSTTTCILSENNDPDMSARVMFCTYQTMINYIDSDVKEFSIGRFDLVIIDEAHRSIFGKYYSIIDYFDSLLVGLTATPRDEVDRNTFDLFKIDAQDTFAYELDEAIEDKYLVPYNALKRGTLIMQQGIVYNNLSDDEKKQLEAVWQYEKSRQGKKILDADDDGHRDIRSDEIFNYIFNINTIDNVLQDLMDKGLKVQSGEQLGKTIIFAYNHKHAELIVQRFNALYPRYGADYCVLIDNYVNYAQDLIDRFGVRDSLPQIAVSVDMLDTGIDIPDILNLVFFKPVKSKIKFLQMIGRGTRLSEGIFGVNRDKQYFNIFDWCNNFEFFSLNPNGKEAQPVQSLTERLFCIRVDIAFELQRRDFQEDAFAKSLHDDLKKELQEQIVALQDTLIAVRQHWKAVDHFRQTENWEYLSSVDVVQLKEEISPLLIKIPTDENAKKFDLLMFNIMLSNLVPEKNASRYVAKVRKIGELLQQRASIPHIAKKMDVIDKVVSSDFWKKPSLDSLEYVRKELRDLIRFIVGGDNQTFVLNIADEIIDQGVADVPITAKSYKQRVVDFLAKNKDLPVIQKIIRIEKLNQADIHELEKILWKELGTQDEYKRYIEKNKLQFGESVGAFIRAQVGVDRRIALERFSEFLSSHALNTMQEEYLKTIIAYVCKNGDITAQTIVNEPPFDAFDWAAVFEGELPNIGRYVNMLHDSIVA